MSLRGDELKKGFSIVEMALVVTIVGLLMAVGFVKIMKPLTDRMLRSKTRVIIDAAADSVIGFAMANGSLPTASGTAAFSGVVRTKIDIWGNDLVYLTDPDLEINSVCDYSSTDITLRKCMDKDCTDVSETINDVAFLILSRGQNLNIQTNTASSTIDTFPYELDGIDKFDGDMSRPEPYKDILKWMVLHEVREKVGCPTAPLRILNLPLPSGLVNKPYSASFYPAGGQPFADGIGDTDIALDYQWCMETEAPDGLAYTCDTTSGDLAVTASSCDDPLATWQNCTNPVLSGTPRTSGAHKIKVFVRDDNNNFADLNFALVINGASGFDICPEYMVWNDFGNKKDYVIRQNNCDNEIGETDCMTVEEDAEVTDALRPLKKDEVLCRYDTSNSNCGGFFLSLSYHQSITTDLNGDCCIFFEKVDRDCP
jgi:prepilin-type N-terminal cleavage/methylation domain-containing protein